MDIQALKDIFLQVEFARHNSIGQVGVYNTRIQSMTMAVVVAASIQAQPVHEERPNIVLFMVDDMGWQVTSVPFWIQRTPLNAKYETPNMERLARQGMLFTQAYASPASLSKKQLVSPVPGLINTRIINLKRNYNDGLYSTLPVTTWWHHAGL